MIPTRRLAVLGFLLTLIAVGAGYSSTLPLAVLDGLAFLAVAVDAVFAFGVRVEVERQVAAILSVGRANAVTLRLRNPTARTLRGVLADDPIDAADARGNPIAFVLGPGEETSIRYQLTPHRRGTRAFGAVTVRCPSPLGLVARQVRTRLDREVDVYPDVHAARSLDLLRRQGRQDARLGSLTVRGSDTEFERLRPYQPGDEVRHVDWRASARRDEIVVRQLQAESNQNVVFALDVGRGMRGESSGLTAIDHAINAALLTAEVALRAGDKAGLLVFDAAPRGFVPPAAGTSGAQKLTRAVFGLEASLAATDYVAAMAFLRNHVRARSLFVVFTNLLEPRSADDLAASLRGLAPKHVPLCVLLRDTDVEALATAPVRGKGDLYVRAAAAEVLAWRDALVRGLAASGVLVLDVAPRELVPQLVKRYLEVKARRLL
ncbi:MAG TPA: DUF58 domain-containing protein [Polyangiaceae bacterium]|jgi:uncharacterized protein (DUF58 family)